VANFHDNSAAFLTGDITNSLKALIKNKQKEKDDISKAMAKLEMDLAKASKDYDEVGVVLFMCHGLLTQCRSRRSSRKLIRRQTLPSRSS
jgi:hypothetical protein